MNFFFVFDSSTMFSSVCLARQTDRFTNMIHYFMNSNINSHLCKPSKTSQSIRIYEFICLFVYQLKLIACVRREEIEEELNVDNV